jgi:GT2 family glycosyltransferase
VKAPVEIRNLDLAQTWETGSSERPVLLVLWWRDLPLGAAPFLPDELPLLRARVAALAGDMIAVQLASRCRDLGGVWAASKDGHPLWACSIDAARAVDDPLGRLDALAASLLVSAEALSVIVCTRDRPDELGRCLAALESQASPAGEILVVDNSAEGTALPVCRQAGVECLHEPRPGLSRARNRGIAACRGELIAFTDDDVEPSPSWCGEIAAAFAGSTADCVTGLVLPAELETAAQLTFQFELGAFGGGFAPLLFGPTFFAETLGMGPQVWRIGAGANMAFRRGVFDRVGPFDERLGAGASGCSEDSELWYRVLAAGGACLYEPRAVVRHHHRREWRALKTQTRAYMRGHVAALFVQAAGHGHRGNRRRVWRQLPAYFARTAFRSIKHEAPERLELLMDEVAGWLGGVGWGLAQRWRADPPATAGILGAPAPEVSHA